MRVMIAKNAGFCMGVKRAMDIVLDTANKASKEEPVYTDGPLIHNPQVLEFLEQKGISVLDEDTNPDGINVVIRAHGIKPDRKEKIENSGAKVCDATCPNVKSVQVIIKRYAAQGYSTVIVGDKGHAEVDGLLGYTGDNGYVVENVDDISKLPEMEKVCVVSQTTQCKEVFNQVAEILKEKHKECKVFATICSSTSKRQKDIVDLSKEVNAMVVVGGRNSANTKRLAEISETYLPTFLIETEEELDMKKLMRYGLIGVTAGASTPNWMINRVVNKIESCNQDTGSTASKYIHNFGRFMIGSGFYLGIGAGFMSYANTVLLNIKPQLFFCIIAFLFIFSLYMFNNLANKESIEFNEPQKAKYYDKHHRLFLGLGIGGAVLSIILASFVNIPVFLCLLFSAVLGILYSLKINPKKIPKFIKYNSLAQIPGSKEIFSSIAWAVCTSLILFFGNMTNSISELVVAFAFTFSISFIRGVFLGIKEMQGDRLVGKETIPVAIGKEKAKQLLAIISFFTGILLIISPIVGWTSNFSLFLLPCIAYACSYLYLFHKRILRNGMLCEALADLNFLLAGIMAYVWQICQI